MKQLGVIFALLCAIAWAFWGMFSKLSTNHGVPPTTLAFLSTCASFVVIVGTYAWQRFPTAPTAAGILCALMSGVCGAIGMLFFSIAIKRGEAAIIVTLSAIYPIFIVLLSPLILQEKLSLPCHWGVAGNTGRDPGGALSTAPDYCVELIPPVSVAGAV